MRVFSVAADDFYGTLGVASDADAAEIKRAYRGIALRLHPDKCAAEGAEEAFKRVSAAYEALRDPEERRRYDMGGGKAREEAQRGERADRGYGERARHTLPPVWPCAPIKIKETVDRRALLWLREMTQDDYARLFPGERSEVNDGWEAFQRVLGHFKHAVNVRTYAVDRKHAPTRYYCFASAQSLRRAMRGLLIGELADGWDMTNQLPTALRYICACLRVDAPRLGEYCDQRDEKLRDLMKSASVTYRQAKRMFLKCVNWKHKTLKVYDPFFKAFDAEMKRLQMVLMLRPELAWALRFAKQDPNPKKLNKEGSFMTVIYANGLRALACTRR